MSALSETLSTDAEKLTARSVASVTFPLWWQRRRREQLYSHVLQALVHTRQTCVLDPARARASTEAGLRALR